MTDKETKIYNEIVGLIESETEELTEKEIFRYWEGYLDGLTTHHIIDAIEWMHINRELTKAFLLSLD